MLSLFPPVFVFAPIRLLGDADKLKIRLGLKCFEQLDKFGRFEFLTHINQLFHNVDSSLKVL